MASTLASRKLTGEALLVLAVAVGVFALAFACLEAPRNAGRVAPVWLANGLAVAFMLRNPWRLWPAMLSAAMLGDLAANLLSGDDALLAAGVAACNVFEILACAGLARRLSGPDLDLVRWRDIRAFALAVGISATLTAIAGALLLSALGRGVFLSDLTVWATADGLGMLIVTPALLSISHMKSDLAEQPITRAHLIAFALFAGVVLLAFGQHRYPVVFIVPAALILTSLQTERVGATIALVIVVGVGLATATYGHGALDLVPGGPFDRAVMVQIFLATCTLCSLPVAAHATARRRLNARLEQARREAEAAAGAKSEFLANMSHELRTPLTSILGFTKLAADQGELSEKSRGYVERVRVASEALLATVNDILDFSKLESGQVTLKPRPAAPVAVARSALALFGPQAAEKTLSLALECGCGEDLLVQIDPDRLRQILINLIGNAVKFTEHGGITLTVGHTADCLRLEVTDTGVGIPTERRGELFRRFSQIDGSSTRVHGGTGLGLAICKGLTEAMGGQIGVESEVGRGSRFWLEIPAPALDDPLSVEAQPESAELSQGLHVLVVDDNPANRELVDLILTAVGVQVTQADDGQTAVALCAETAFDLVLMDLRMPGMGGEEALRQIRASQGPNDATPILAFTADVYQEDGADTRLHGFDGRLAKPLRPEELLQAVAAATHASPDLPNLRAAQAD